MSQVRPHNHVEGWGLPLSNRSWCSSQTSHHAHRGLPNDRTTCGARKRPHEGKNHESFLLQIIGTGLTHRRDAVQRRSGPRPGQKHWADRPQIRGSPLHNKLAHRGLPDRHSYLWAGARQRPPPSLGTACRDINKHNKKKAATKCCLSQRTSDFGPPDLANLAKTNFGQTNLGQSIFGNSFLDLVCVMVGPSKVGPRTGWGRKGGRAKISRFFSLSRHNLHSSNSWGSSRGIWVVFLKDPQRCTLGVLGLLRDLKPRKKSANYWTSHPSGTVSNMIRILSVNLLLFVVDYIFQKM